MSLPPFLKKIPSKIVAVGLNYRNHAKELNMEIPNHPIIFLKPNTSIISNGEKIIIPEMSQRVEYEAELAFMIKKKCKNVSEKDALNYVEGFTCLNDVTARDLQKIDGQWTRAKSFDTFCPIGPRLVKPSELKKQNLEPNNLKIQLCVNGELKQNSSTSEFIFKVEKVISFISKIMTLNPGDIITTGTPPGVGQIKKGDVVEVNIEGIGTLSNCVE
jgi:2-keto-4-pentenoate hydratase/2-oxohepta-3-ene-1,7-dioic acid hydratase in catechol pathway